MPPLEDESSTCLYAALGVSPLASQSDLRSAYKTICLSLHPDKQAQLQRIGGGTTNQPSHTTGTESDAAVSRLQAAQRAWAVLSVPESRRAYDDARQAHSRNADARVVADTLTFDELDTNEMYGERWTDCRCGGRYVLPQCDFVHMQASGVVVACDTCSLAVRVIDR